MATRSPAGQQPADSHRRTNSSQYKPQSVKELCLRFVCPNCQRLLSVPLRSIGTKDKCPGCSKTVTIPNLDGDVDGLSVVLEARGNAASLTWPTACPECSDRIEVDRPNFDRPFACSKCGQSIRVAIVSIPVASKNAASTSGRASTTQDTAIPPPPVEHDPSPPPHDEEPPLQWLNAEAEKPMPRQPVSSYREHSPVQRGPRPWPMQRPARWIARLIYWGVPFALFQLAYLLDYEPLLIVPVALLIPRI